MHSLEPEVWESRRFACRRHRPVFLSDDNGRASPEVACGDDAVFGEYEHRARPIDCPKDILYTIDKVLAFDDKQSDEFGGIDAPRREFGEHHILSEQLFRYLFRIVYLSDSDKRETPEMRVHEKRLGVSIGYDANAAFAFKLTQFRFELRSEICTLKIVDGTLEALRLCAVSGHAATFRTKM